MIRKFSATIFVSLSLSISAQDDSTTIRSIYDYFLSSSNCYSNLEHLATRIGGRISGSPQAEEAIKWTRQAMYAAGADTVFLQPCLVPKWVRGEKEKCLLKSGRKKNRIAVYRPGKLCIYSCKRHRSGGY